MVTNDWDELLNLRLTSRNCDDRRAMPELIKGLFGKLFGAKGYVSQALFKTLYDDGLQLVTKIKTKIKNRFLTMLDKIMLRERAIIDSMTDQLKNI